MTIMMMWMVSRPRGVRTLSHAVKQAAAPAASILRLGDERLKQKSATVTDFNDQHFVMGNEMLHAALAKFRAENGFGRGIAAPQIGCFLRFIALNLAKDPSPPLPSPFTIVNPVVTWKSDKTFTLWDDCMCFPELMVKVRRHMSISVEFQDVRGKVHQWRHISQAFSELIQHEMDHLDGILAVDLAIEPPISRQLYLKHRAAYDAQVEYAILPTLS